MKIDERIGDAGEAIAVTLERRGSAIALCDGVTEIGALPLDVVITVMRRYGRPLDDGLAANGESIELTSECRLARLRFRAIVDAEPRDWLVLEGDGEPIAADGRTIAAALRFLISASSPDRP